MLSVYRVNIDIGKTKLNTGLILIEDV